MGEEGEEYYGYHIGEEDKGLLDPAWERQQKKTFTAWCNSHLRKIGEGEVQIELIEEDFRDGLKLMLLLEVLSGERLPKPERGRMRVHLINNLNKALDFIMSKGVKLVGVGAEEICDGNLKMTLGMIWTIILRFAIQDIMEDNLSSKEGLLLWCQRKTAPYKNVNVQNFHMSFKDGLAFCALIHRHRPDLIDYDKLHSGDPRTNLETAFQVAEDHLDIPKMLDVDDMVNCAKPDERAVMTYVSCYYHALTSNQKAEGAAKKICHAININKGNEKDIEDYENLASDLVDWLNKKIPELEDRDIDDPKLKNAQDKLEQFRDYSRNEKPPKVNDKSNLENLYNTIMTKLRLGNRPPFLPSEGKMIRDIDDLWKRLEGAEKDFLKWILLELRKLERLDHLVAKFKHKCDIHESWSQGKSDFLTSDVSYTLGLPTLLAMRKKHEAFESDLTAQQDRVEQIVAIAQELANLQYSKIGEIEIRRKTICDGWDTLSDLTMARSQKLQDAIEKAERLDNMWLEYAKRASPFVNWLDGAQEDLLDVVIVHTLEEIKDLKEAHMKFVANMPAAKEEYEGIVEIYQQIQQLTSEENPYTHTECKDIVSKMQIVEELIDTRAKKLTEVEGQQERNEKLRIEFATLANQTAQLLDQRRRMLNEINLKASGGTLDGMLTSTKALLEEMVNFRSQIDQLENINERVQEAMIFENEHTRFSMEEIRINYEQGTVGIQRTINQIENQILMRDSLNMSEGQISEITESFKYFDKDGSNKLDYNEFLQCLMSLGHVGSDDMDDPDFVKIVQRVDPNNIGYVTLDGFMAYMQEENMQVDTSETVEDSFKVLAGDKPYITAEELRRELPPEQAEYCIGKMPAYMGPDAVEGALDYKAFASALYGESDL